MNDALEKLLQKIEENVNDLTTLNIKTVMGKLKVDDDGNINFEKEQEIQGIISNIDLIDGDISTEITEPFYKSYPELVQFHQSREAKGHEIIENNISALKTIASTLLTIKDGK